MDLEALDAIGLEGVVDFLHEVLGSVDVQGHGNGSRSGDQGGLKLDEDEHPFALRDLFDVIHDGCQLGAMFPAFPEGFQG